MAALNELASLVLDRMQERPGHPFRASELAELLVQPPEVVSSALAGLEASQPEISSPEDGVWIYNGDGTLGTTNPKPRPWGGRAAVERYLKDHPGELVTSAALAEELEASLAMVSRTLTTLTKTLPGVERRGRGKYVYYPNKLDELTRTTGRLRLLKSELDRHDLANPVRTVLRSEKEQLEAKLADLLGPTAGAQGAQPAQTAEAIPTIPGSPPADVPARFETVATHRTGAMVLRDENDELWLANPVRIDLPALGWDKVKDRPQEAEEGS